MLTLYIKDNCWHSRRVLDALEQSGIPFEEKNIKDPIVASELIERGGKTQVPFLVDDDPCKNAEHKTPCLIDESVELYDSHDIIKYLEENYAE